MERRRKEGILRRASGKKCLLDFAHQDLERRTTREIYEALDEFLRQTDPARATKQRLCDTVYDLAADRGVEAAETDRDGILNAYHRSLSAAKFRTYMGYLADWCAAGTADVAQNSEKAQFWRAKM